MSEKKRRWFQIHLSTAIVLMFVAGGLMWANFVPRITPDGISYENLLNSEPVIALTLYDTGAHYNWGWPTTLYSAGKFDLYTPHWHSSGIFANIAVGILLLAVVAVILELIIRRREVREP